MWVCLGRIGVCERVESVCECVGVGVMVWRW